METQTRPRSLLGALLLRMVSSVALLGHTMKQIRCHRFLLVISRLAHACSAETMVCLFGRPKRSCLDDVGWMQDVELLHVAMH